MAFRWSASRLLTYLKCPYAYLLKYKKRISVPVPWYYLFGKVIHKAIEICHKGQPHQLFEPTSDRPLFFKSAKKFGGFWTWLWEKKVEEAISETGIRWRYSDHYQILKGYGWKLLAGTEDRQYKGYYDCISNPPFPIKILEVEYRVEQNLWGFPFVGIIDQVWETEEGTAVVDITTSRLNKTKFLQMSIYHHLLKELCQEDPNMRERFGESPAQHFVWSLGGECLVPIQPHEPEELKETFLHVANGVQFGNFPRTHQDHVCGSCEYRKVCGKLPGESIPVGKGGEVEISFPKESSRPRSKQLYFTEGAEGGWFRGSQVKEG